MSDLPMPDLPLSEEPVIQEVTPAGPPTAQPGPQGPTWFHRLSSVIFVIFCFELGLFLLIYPWTDAWTENSLSLFAPARVAAEWRVVWNNSYFRGAISGVGILNIWIAVTEVFGMFSRRSR